MKQTGGRTKRPIALRPRFFELAAANGWGSDAAIAAKVGTVRSAVWRIRTGRVAPSEGFIAGVLAALPDSTFEDLFDVEQVAS